MTRRPSWPSRFLFSAKTRGYPGGGGGGGATFIWGEGWHNGFGGGGYAEKTYQYGVLPSSVTVVVGAGGAGKDRYSGSRGFKIAFTQLSPRPILLDTKFLNLHVKHELFTSDQRNVQETPVTFEPLPRNALNKSMALEQSGPNCWESISRAH